MKYARPLCLAALVISVGLLMQACAVASVASATAQAGGAVVGVGAGATKKVGRTVF
jgi:hypothetical protein